MRIAFLMSLIFWGVIILFVSACSFQVQFGYHGETAIDDKTYTAAKK